MNSSSFTQPQRVLGMLVEFSAIVRDRERYARYRGQRAVLRTSLFDFDLYDVASTNTEPATRGQFGDMFGAVNALFSGLAFSILIYTMWLQRKDLELQREELRSTREELRLTRLESTRTADAQEASQRSLNQQVELSARSTEMSAWLQAQKVWTERSFTEARGRLLTRWRLQYSLGPQTTWSAAERDEAKELCRRLDEFAQLAPFLGGNDRVLGVWDDPLAKCWLVLELIVNEERELTGWRTKWHSFESLGKAALGKLQSEGRDPRGEPPTNK